MNQTIYCDHAATTHLKEEVRDFMNQYEQDSYGNPSSLHPIGKKAKDLLIQARQICADCLQASPDELHFTSGGTESIHLALFGAIKANPKKKKIISSPIEHSAVYNTLKYLESKDYQIHWLKPNAEGQISSEELSEALDDNTALVTLMSANNEMGALQKVGEIAQICRTHEILFHTDAVQAAGKIPVDLSEAKVDLLSISGHKFYGPKGTGLLYKRKESKVARLSFGGNQEGGFRSGTENVLGWLGLAKALSLACSKLSQESQRLQEMQSVLMSALANLPAFVLNGPSKLEERLPGNLNYSIRGVSGDQAVLQMAFRGICVSSGSACSEGKIDPSRVILALNPSEPWRAGSSIRISLGALNHADQLDRILAALKSLVR